LIMFQDFIRPPLVGGNGNSMVMIKIFSTIKPHSK
jgi:hypothetical protein